MSVSQKVAEVSKTRKRLSTKQESRAEKVYFDSEEFVLRKRLPPRLSKRPNDVYVNNRTDFKAQLARCFKCLEKEPNVYIHGLGSAAPKAINLALQLQLKSSTPLDFEVDTSTVKLFGMVL